MNTQNNQAANAAFTVSAMISEAVYRIVIWAERMIRHLGYRNAHDGRA